MTRHWLRRLRVRDIDVTHNNSSPSPRKHSIFRQIYRSLILCQCPRLVNKPDPANTCALWLNGFINSHAQEGKVISLNRNCINKISLNDMVKLNFYKLKLNIILSLKTLNIVLYKCINLYI